MHVNMCVGLIILSIENLYIGCYVALYIYLLWHVAHIEARRVGQMPEWSISAPS